MPEGDGAITVRMVEHIADIEAAAWDACAGIDGMRGNPFVSHAFLSALEDSGSVAADQGWAPRHLVVEDADGTLLACAPLYVKGHSYGEYVFDHGWADAWERAGGRYYPKLQLAVPFTPVTGPRLLVRPGPQAVHNRDVLVRGLIETARRTGVSSLHVTFAPEAEARVMEEAGFMLRLGEQFHWHNRGYERFDDFLAALSSRKRKAIRKERRQVAESGVAIRPLTGNEIKARHWDAFFAHYTSTSDRKWGWPYLTREFFDLLGERLGDRVVLVMAEDEGGLVAGALNLRDDEGLYGRNWGCIGHFRFLHFEACYYQAIDYAIAHGLARVEAGAQGPHKIQRGYLPVKTWSAHWITDPNFRSAVADFLDRERQAVERDLAALAGHSPYRQED